MLRMSWRRRRANAPTITRTLILLIALALGACTPAEDPAPVTSESVATPSPAPSAPNERPSQRREIISENLPYAEIGDGLVYGHFAIPADMIDPLPAVVIVHDWFGLNQTVRSAAERLAGDGFIVLAVDLFRGRTADTVGLARELEIDVIENTRLAEDNLRQAIDFIRISSGAPSIAIVGYGFGGGWALRTALASPDRLDAAVSFYGQVITDEDQLAEARVPFLGFFSASDRAVPVQTVREFEASMRSLEKEASVNILEDVRRGFVDVASENYDGAKAGEAWRTMVSFLTEQMSPGSD